VRTHRRPKRICDFRKGDIVRNVAGLAVVKEVFCNRVELNRVVRLTFDDGRVIFTTRQHEFLTDCGWVEAQNLDDQHCIFGVGGYLMDSNFPTPEVSNDLRLVQDSVRVEESKQKTTMLYEELCLSSEGVQEREREESHEEVSVLQEVYGVSRVESEGVLQPILSGPSQFEPSGNPSEIVPPVGRQEDQSKPQAISYHGSWQETSRITLSQDEREQPWIEPGNYRQDEGYQREEGDVTRLAGRAGRERESDFTGTVAVRCVGSGVANAHGGSDEAEVSVSDELQTRHRASEAQDRHRGRWEDASVERGYVERCQKGTTSHRGVRLASVEVYQQGCNEPSFVGVITDQDRSRGFVEFYDLQVCGHPSYFANGLPVHNCHKLTADAQTAFLKIAEEPPSWVYFFFCTTDPSKVLATLRGRSTVVKLDPLSPADLTKLLTSIASKEDVKIGLEVIEKIVDVSEGSAREAVKRLNAAIHLESDEDRLRAIEDPVAKRQAFDLVRLLVYDKQPTWSKAVELLKSVEVGNRESFRHFVLACARTELLKANGNATRAWKVIDICKTPWYNFEEVGLEHSVFEVCQEISGRK
jgi:DNA polymerase III gamma/tau subunit